MNKTIENVVISVICAVALLLMLYAAVTHYSEKDKQEKIVEESTITASASSSCEAWILLGGEWTHIDVEDYSLAGSNIITLYCADNVKYKTAYVNVVLIENGG